MLGVLLVFLLAAYQVQAANGLVAAYGFEEGTGTTAADASGTGNSGTTSNTTWSTAGKYGKALSFNGSSSYVNVPDSNSLDLTTGMTIEAWVRPSSLGSAWRTVVLKQQTGALAYGLYANNNATRPVGYVFNAAERSAGGSSALAVNTWSHLATTYDGANLRLYVNGVLAATTATTGNIVVSTGVLRIGGNSVWGEYFSGLIDEVRIYNRALSAGEIQVDMATPVSMPDTTPPTDPTGITQTGATEVSVSLSWTASTDNLALAGYGLYRDGALVATATSTSATLTGLTCSTSYLFAVDGYDNAGNRSGKATLTGATSPCDTVAPTTPGNVAVSAVSDTSATVRWDPSMDNIGVTGYDLFVGGQPAGGTTSTSATFTGLGCGTPYTFGVAAHDARGNASDVASASTTTAGCDTTVPLVAITSPNEGATVTGNVSVGANASDDVGVAGVQFLLNGANLGTEDTTSPYSVGWNTQTVANGVYTLSARARDGAGNQATSTLVSVTVSNTVNPVGLVAAYGFEEGFGPQAMDVTGNGNNGAISEAVRVPGRSGGALQYDGINDYVSVNDSSPLDLTTRMTLEAWVKPTVAPSSWRNIVVKERSGGSQAYQLAAGSSSSNRPANRVYASGATRTLYGGSQLAAGAWTHLAATYDGANQRLYVNGVQVSSRAQTGSISTSSSPLRIGGSPTLGQYFSGLIDEVRIYNRALSAGEIQVDMATPVSMPDTTPPTDPTGITQTGATEVSVSLSWTASTDNLALAGYGLYRDGALVATATSTSATLTGLTCSTSYLFAVDGYDNAGNRSGKATLTGATSPCDTVAPTISITAPSSGATVSGNVTLSADASDNLSLVGVQFAVDGSNVGAEDTTPPYSIAWNSNAVSNGAHSITAAARDLSGNTTTATSVGVNVSNTLNTGDAFKRVTIGPGFVEASNRQVVRTASDYVYAILADDTAQRHGSGAGVIRAWKANRSGIPTAFAEVDTANHPTSTGTNILASPDLRLDRSGLIHVVYVNNSNSNLIYRTFSTITDTWGPPTTLATNARVLTGGGIMRTGNASLVLDSHDAPHVVYMTTANTVVYLNKVTGSWSAPQTLSSGSAPIHPALATDGSDVLHLAWDVNSVSTTSTIMYKQRSASGTWSADEVVDSSALNNNSLDQSPAIALDASGRPYVLYLSTSDYVRIKYRSAPGAWVANDPTPNLYAHTPTIYMRSNDLYAFLGHDANIHPGYQYQLSGAPWSPYAVLDPVGSPDGSASTRWDPMRDYNPGVIDLLYFDEDIDGSYAPRAYYMGVLPSGG